MTPSARAICARSPVRSRLWRLRDRTTLREVARRGHRRRAGPLTVLWLLEAADGPPQVAYAVGRRVGPAVVRNRVKRRLRAVMHDLGPQVQPGAYLVRAEAGVAALTFDEMRSFMARAVLVSKPNSTRP